MISINNKLILKPYSGERKIKTEVRSGFSVAKQKSSLIGLEVLVDAELAVGGEKTFLKKGQKVYFLEDVLYTQDWSKKTYSCEALKESFIIANFSEVVFVK